MDLRNLAANLHREAGVFQRECVRAGLQGVAEQVRGFVDMLDQTFDLGPIVQARGIPRLSFKRLQGQLQYQKRKREEAEQSLESALKPRQGLRITALWWIRVGLAEPSWPAGSLSSFVRDFPADERPDISISRTSVTRARDTVAELLKRFCKSELARAGSLLESHGRGVDSQSESVVLVQCHDEANMRVRSFLGKQVLRGARSRFSSIQNEAVTVYTAVSACSLEYWTELVALGRKNAASIGQAVISTVLDVITALLEGLQTQASPPQKLRLVHVLTADGAPTNEAVAKKVLFGMTRYRASDISYHLISFKCATHQANLTVQTAICGKPMSNAARDNALVGTCIRMFRYVVDQYHGEFYQALTAHIEANLLTPVLPDGPSDWFAGSMTDTYLALYGRDVLPEDFLQVLNVCPSRLVHAYSGTEDDISVLKGAADILCRSKSLLEIQERLRIS